MSKIEVGQVYILDIFSDGRQTLAKVKSIEGRIFKKYSCMVWGIKKDGSNDWPNGYVPYYENYVKKSELTKRWGSQ